MGFPIEFNHLVVLPKAMPDLPDLFGQAAAHNLAAAAPDQKQELYFTKDGARLYPMGYELPVAIGKDPWDVIGYAKVIQQGIDDCGFGQYRTRIRLGEIRGLSHT